MPNRKSRRRPTYPPQARGRPDFQLLRIINLLTGGLCSEKSAFGSFNFLGIPMIGFTRRRTLIAAAALAMTGCGFRLRGRFSLPFETLYISYNLNTPLGSQLSRQIKAGSDVRLVNSPSQAQAILQILGEKRSRNVVAYNALGEAREYELKLEISFRLASPQGALYLPDTSIAAVREISYNDADYLSRDSEESLVINEMMSDIVVQMVRRIEKAQPPKKAEDLGTR